MDVPVYVHEEELKYAYYSVKTDEGSDAYVLDDFDHDLDWQVVHRPVETPSRTCSSSTCRGTRWD